MQNYSLTLSYSISFATSYSVTQKLQAIIAFYKRLVNLPEMADLDVNHVAIQIKAMLGEAKPFFPAECCIYRVPYEICKLNQDAYTPKVVSVGPFHYGDSRLLNMEGHKRIYCQKFLQRSEATLEKLVSCLQGLEPKVRSSYSENIKLSKEDFVKVMLVDCGFIFELFLRYRFGQWTDNDAISLTPWLRSDIRLDLLLLENQLPFFVFEELYNLAFASRSKGGDDPSFLRLSFRYFDDRGLMLNFPGICSIAHFTDLLRTFYLQPSNKRPSREDKLLTHLHSATELKEAGVKFQVNETSHCLLDLEFSGRILTIPQIKVEDSTEILLRNMVALEQCHYPDDSYITDYVAVLDFLINTDKDVEILVKNGIIVNWLGDSNAVAKMFGGLWKNVTQANFNVKYLHIGKELNAFCKHPLHRRMATLRRDYCNTPWKMAASIAAIILLILTVVQTVCSILQVNW